MRGEIAVLYAAIIKSPLRRIGTVIKIIPVPLTRGKAGEFKIPNLINEHPTR